MQKPLIALVLCAMPALCQPGAARHVFGKKFCNDTPGTSKKFMAWDDSAGCYRPLAIADLFSGSGDYLKADGTTGTPSSSSLLSILATTGNGTVSAANLQRSLLTNTGASGAVELTLGSATCTAGQSFTAYLTVAQPIKLIPYTGDRIQILTDAVSNSITSDAVIGSFVSLACLSTGNWYLLGLNGAWTDTN